MSRMNIGRYLQNEQSMFELYDGLLEVASSRCVARG